MENVEEYSDPVASYITIARREISCRRVVKSKTSAVMKVLSFLSNLMFWKLPPTSFQHSSGKIDNGCTLLSFE